MRAWKPALGLFLLFAFYLSLAALLPPIDDELYYWCWSKELQLSYFDHPPLTAYLIGLSTYLFGDSLVAIRLPACLSSTIVVGLLGYLTQSRWVLAAVFCSPLLTYGAVLMTPDSPLLLLWTAYLTWLTTIHRRLAESTTAPTMLMWYVGGCLLGCGVLGKYTMALVVPAGGLSFLLLGRASIHRWLLGYLYHGIIAFFVSIPILIYNIHRDFEPLLFQWKHAASIGGDGLKDGFRTFGEFVGIQVVLAGTLPVVLLPWVVSRWDALLAVPRLRACLCLYLFPFLFFLWKASRGPLEGNWAMASFLGFWPLAAVWFREVKALPRWRWAGRLAFAPPVFAVLFLAIHMIYPLPVLPPNRDRITRLYDRHHLTERVAKRIAAEPAPVFTPYYQSVAQLRFFGADARQEPEMSRPSHFTLGQDRMANHDRVYYFAEFPMPASHTENFEPPEKVETFRLNVRGVKFDDYTLWLYRRSSSSQRN